MFSQVPKPVREKISESLSCTIKDFTFASGGCINHGGRLETSIGSFFLKWNDAQKFPGMFKAERNGLRILDETRAIRIPQVIAASEVDTYQYLLLEHIQQASPNKKFWQSLGVQLSELHRKSASHFGIDFDNYIGSLPQRNTKHSDWISFFVEHRLKPQIAIGQQHGNLPDHVARDFEILYQKLSSLIVKEMPSLLHGDLWSGNLISDEHGNPSLIDPAVYYGNREAELAFTKLFGGFSAEFYDSYNSNFPLEKGFESRIDLYNLYPLLVHVNLFGGGYLNQVVSILRKFV